MNDDTFNFSFREMLNWYDESKDDEDLFSSDEKVMAIFVDRVQKYEMTNKKRCC